MVHPTLVEEGAPIGSTLLGSAKKSDNNISLTPITQAPWNHDIE
jgi:hypothetical protein